MTTNLEGHDGKLVVNNADTPEKREEARRLALQLAKEKAEMRFGCQLLLLVFVCGVAAGWVAAVILMMVGNQ